MSKIFITSCFIILCSLCILFGLPYVGVDLVGVLVVVLVICGLLAYLTRPAEIKSIEKSVNQIMRDITGDIKSGLQDINDDNQLERIIKKNLLITMSCQ